MIWERTRDPLDALNRDKNRLTILRDNSYIVVTTTREKRHFRDITFTSEEGDSIKVTLSLPVEMNNERLPVLVILGGLRTGRRNLKLIPDHGKNILIGYEYPYNQRKWEKNIKLFEIFVIRQAILRVPSAVAAITMWASDQIWADKQRICLLGCSFGAFFTPSICRIVASNQLILGPNIIAFGGTDIYEMLHFNFRFHPEWLRKPLAWIAATAIRPVEPALHLPLMKGEFLVINGKYDEKIPSTSVEGIQKLTPDPKTIINLEESHMHPKKPELTKLVVETGIQWLLERGAINR